MFRSGVNLVLVDVVVRDRTGAFIKDLTADDFELFEDGVRQQIVTFAVEEIAQKAAPLETSSTLTAAAIDSRRGADARAAAPVATANPATDTSTTPEPTPADIGGRRRPSSADARVRHQLDAARGRAEGDRLGDRMGQRADDDGGSRCRRVDRLRPAGADRLHERQGTSARGARRVRRDRRHGVYGRRREHGGDRRSRAGGNRGRPPIRALRNSTPSTTTSGCAR